MTHLEHAGDSLDGLEGGLVVLLLRGQLRNGLRNHAVKHVVPNVIQEGRPTADGSLLVGAHNHKHALVVALLDGGVPVLEDLVRELEGVRRELELPHRHHVQVVAGLLLQILQLACDRPLASLAQDATVVHHVAWSKRARRGEGRAIQSSRLASRPAIERAEREEGKRSEAEGEKGGAAPPMRACVEVAFADRGLQWVPTNAKRHKIFLSLSLSRVRFRSRSSLTCFGDGGFKDVEFGGNGGPADGRGRDEGGQARRSDLARDRRPVLPLGRLGRHDKASAPGLSPWTALGPRHHRARPPRIHTTAERLARTHHALHRRHTLMQSPRPLSVKLISLTKVKVAATTLVSTQRPGTRSRSRSPRSSALATGEILRLFLCLSLAPTV